ncbi:MAG: DUF4097 family beta strand repeat-containing protein [Saccharofermentanales bacterium]|jgi:hypothetical protein
MKTWHNTIKYVAIALAIVIIIGIVGFIMNLFSFAFSYFTPDVTGDNKSYKIENEIRVLEIDLNSINLEVKTTTDSDFKVDSNYKYLTVTEKDDKLLIKDKKAFSFNIQGKAALTLYIPENMVLDKVEIVTGAGSTDLENLQADNIIMKFGAGKTMLQNISSFEKTDIEAGAGKLIVRDSTFNNLDLEMGVGQFEFSGKLLGKNSLKMGVGSSQIDLTGSLDDYKLDVEKGIGDIYVGDDKLKSNTQIGQGDRELDFEGGIGSVKINFSE